MPPICGISVLEQKLNQWYKTWCRSMRIFVLVAHKRMMHLLHDYVSCEYEFLGDFWNMYKNHINHMSVNVPEWKCWYSCKLCFCRPQRDNFLRVPRRRQHTLGGILLRMLSASPPATDEVCSVDCWKRCFCCCCDSSFLSSVQPNLPSTYRLNARSVHVFRRNHAAKRKMGMRNVFVDGKSYVYYYFRIKLSRDADCIRFQRREMVNWGSTLPICFPILASAL